VIPDSTFRCRMAWHFT